MSVIEDRLRAAAQDLAAVPVPDLSGAVRRELAASPRPAARPSRLLGPVPAVALGLAVLVIATSLAVPSARQAVADFLGLPGLRVEVVPDPPAVGNALDLGDRVSLADARAAVAFPVRVPDALGAPDEVWLDRDVVSGGQVTLLWRADRDLPATGTPGVGALLTVLPGTLEPGSLTKVVHDPDTALTSVQVGTAAGWWISGPGHTLVYRDADGRVRQERSRRAGDTLLWQQADVLYRLESGLPLAQALRVARSLD